LRLADEGGSMADGQWRQLDRDDESKRRVVTVKAKAESPLGQRLLSDPLGALIDSPQKGEVDGTWQVVSLCPNAHIPSGPVPLPEDVEADCAGVAQGEEPWVIRKLIADYLIYPDQKQVAFLPLRFDTDKLITREAVLGVLERSLEQRRARG
jgi:hypothetical protein